MSATRNPQPGPDDSLTPMLCIIIAALLLMVYALASREPSPCAELAMREEMHRDELDRSAAWLEKLLPLASCEASARVGVDMADPEGWLVAVDEAQAWVSSR